jgi:uncharacterized damage-inducible protein DinB
LEENMEDLRYPIGKFQFDAEVTPAKRQEWLAAIAQLPSQLREVVKVWSDRQLDTPYRPGGWTVRQVIHHLADSHLHSYIRFRFALTLNEPTIQPYDEARWAELADAKNAAAELSLSLLDGLHARWVCLVKSLAAADFARTLKHPERGTLTLDQLLNLYAWHSRHHLAHITALRDRMGWK